MANPRYTATIQQVDQCTKKPRRNEKAGDVWQKILVDTKPTPTPLHKPTWIDTANHTFELIRQNTGNSGSNHVHIGEGLR